MLTPIPRNRTCTQTGIPTWFCACAGNWEYGCPLTMRRIETIAQIAIDEANRDIDNFPRASHVCQRLTLKRVIACESQGESLDRLRKQAVKRDELAAALAAGVVADTAERPRAFD